MHPSLLIQCVKIFRSNLRSHARAVTIQTIWCKKGLVRPFFPTSSQWSHLIAIKTPQIIQNVRPCLHLISEVTPSLFVNTIISWVTHDNQKLVYFLINSSRLYVLSHKFISHITLTYRFNLTSHAEYIVLCVVSHLVIKILSEVSHVFGDKGWSQVSKFEQGSNKWKSAT